MGSADSVVKMTGEGGLAVLRSLRARSFTTSAETARHPGCGRARARWEGKRAGSSGRFVHDIRDRANITSVSVGNPAMMSAPKTISGRTRFAREKGDASAREWRRFMRFRIMSSLIAATDGGAA